MRTKLWLLLSCAAIAGAGVVSVINRPASNDGIEVARASSANSFVWKEPQSSVGLCPWRSPEEDRKRFFPASITYQDQTLILSRQRKQLQDRLGHIPTGDESALIVHRIQNASGSPGVVVTRRVRGECGLIELVIAADPAGRVLGAKIQRHREPASTAQAIQSAAWLDAFRGKDSRSAWQLGQDVPDVPAVSRVSAEAIVKEAHTALILLDVALHSDSALPPAGAHEDHLHGQEPQ